MNTVSPFYKKQLASHYWVTILLNIKHFAGQEAFHCLYGGVPLFEITKSETFFARLTSFTSIILLLFPLIKKSSWRKQWSRQCGLIPSCYKTKGAQGSFSFWNASGILFSMYQQKRRIQVGGGRASFTAEII